MNIRLGKKLLADLRAASTRYDHTFSEIARMALRRARRDSVALSVVTTETTYRGEAIRFELKKAKGQSTNAETLRRALTWYLSRYDLTAPCAPEFNTDLRPGIDYIVQESPS